MSGVGIAVLATRSVRWAFVSTPCVGAESKIEAMASTRRPPSRKGPDPAAGVLRRFIEAIESGELMDTTPQDVVVVRRLQGALNALESVSGDARRESKPAG